MCKRRMQFGTVAKEIFVSVQAGIWNFDGKPVDRTLLGEFSEALKQQGPDGEFWHVDGSISLLYRPFHTTAESRQEKQPYVSARGFIITWDGRLDNREELASELGHDVKGDATDVGLFGAAFDRWDSECFRRIIGDWAVSIWTPQERELIFACDFMAIRHIFYYLKNERIWWSTNLTPLVLLSGDKFHIDDEYIAGYFANDPEAHLTPYREIREVPPGQFVRVRNGIASVERFWKFDPQSRIRYKTDTEYEEHFRHVFRQSVRRRLRSDSPILAELSGGIDSSTIVCVADAIMKREGKQAPRLDTLSYFDNTEPNGDDWTYFHKIEAYRQSTGHHIDASTSGRELLLSAPTGFNAIPGSVVSTVGTESERNALLRIHSYRVLLSGFGGDDFTGGVPDPRAQIADLIVLGQVRSLVRQITAWSLIKRRPWIHLFWHAAVDAAPPSLGQYLVPEAKPEPWIRRSFARKSKLSVRRLAVTEDFGLHLPSRRSYIGAVWAMGNKLSKFQACESSEEVRYPFLDQDLIEFILAIPSTQLLRPSERRSLMRRAMKDTVPHVVLWRSTKQTGARAFILALERQQTSLQRIYQRSVSAALGYVDDWQILQAIEAVRTGRITSLTRLLLAFSLEFWLRDQIARELLFLPLSGNSSLNLRPASFPSMVTPKDLLSRSIGTEYYQKEHNHELQKT
jgi:asparagine synthase (glutamine-hydrolysing)